MGKPPDSRLVLGTKSLRIPGVSHLGRYRYTAARSGLKPHSHGTSLEICLLAKGCQTYRINGRIYRLKGGEQFVAFPHEVHDTAGAPEERGALYWLILDISPLRKEILFLGAEASAWLMTALRRLPVRHFRADPASWETLERVFEALAQRGADRPLRRLRAAQGIVHYLLQTVAAANSNHIPEISKKIRSALDFLDRQPNEWIPVPILAAQAGLSVPRFKVRFRTETGIPPGEFMLRRKIEAAQARLARPGVSVTEVAHGLGFSSSQYFATVFKRHTLRTPSEFMAGTSSKPAS